MLFKSKEKVVLVMFCQESCTVKWLGLLQAFPMTVGYEVLFIPAAAATGDPGVEKWNGQNLHGAEFILTQIERQLLHRKGMWL